jgi:hypothetical protein
MSYWYHGTTSERLKKILKEGLKRGSEISNLSEHFIATHPATFESISLAKREKDAIFFTIGGITKEHIPTQAILKIDIDKLDRGQMKFYPLFDKRESELMYFGDIPTDAIEEVFIRKFEWKDKKLKVEEKRYSKRDFDKLEKVI